MNRLDGDNTNNKSTKHKEVGNDSGGGGGNDNGDGISPHIPKYIVKAPWYADNNSPSYEIPSLSHHKPTLITPSLPKKHQIALVQSTKFRKGACENCGSATHSRKDCLERPRKVGAKWTGQDICPDEISLHNQQALEVLPGVKILSNYDEKRDHWENFESTNFKKSVEPLYEGLLSRFVSRSAAEDESETLNQKVDFESKSRMTVRNLRIREDTAKYLQKNIAPDSVYDPKTRSLRSESNQKVEERWVRASFTDSSKLPTELDCFCWDPERKSTLLPQSSPTQVAYEYEKFKRGQP